MTEYRYRELTEAELRELEPWTHVYCRDSYGSSWQGPKPFMRFRPEHRVYRVETRCSVWCHAAIREPVELKQVVTMGREYQTRDGRAFVPYCIDAPAPYTVHGRLEGESIPRAWRKNGRSPDKRELDLLPAPDWREQIPWDALADWVQWVAYSGDDQIWRAYEYEPVQMERRWGSKRGRSFILSAVRMPTPPADWREAIARRPEAK